MSCSFGSEIACAVAAFQRADTLAVSSSERQTLVEVLAFLQESFGAEADVSSRKCQLDAPPPGVPVPLPADVPTQHTRFDASAETPRPHVRFQHSNDMAAHFRNLAAQSTETRKAPLNGAKRLKAAAAENLKTPPNVAKPLEAEKPEALPNGANPPAVAAEKVEASPKTAKGVELSNKPKPAEPEHSGTPPNMKQLDKELMLRRVKALQRRT
jgi:hypothetical protein